MLNDRVDIRVGQKWRDKDRRREQHGTVREFVVERVSEIQISCRIVRGRSDPEGRSSYFHFNRSRFGSGRANDSFELVEDATC